MDRDPNAYSQLSRKEKREFYGAGKQHRDALQAQRDSYFANRVGAENVRLQQQPRVRTRRPSQNEQRRALQAQLDSNFASRVGQSSNMGPREVLQAQRDSYFASRLGPEVALLAGWTRGLSGREADAIEPHRGRPYDHAAFHDVDRNIRSRSGSASRSRSRSRGRIDSGADDAGGWTMGASGSSNNSRLRSRSGSRSSSGFGTVFDPPATTHNFTLPSRPESSARMQSTRSRTPGMQPFYNDLPSPSHTFNSSTRPASHTSTHATGPHTPAMQPFYNDLLDHRIYSDIFQTYDTTMTLLPPIRNFDRSTLVPNPHLPPMQTRTGQRAHTPMLAPLRPPSRHPSP